ncbi:uroporphyrinogen-III synthase [Rhodovibrio salinarum]|uniref:Uroporphyrinogen-III synthase n=1 Tax=Rhodovibrio salinarum TaxID=1087 RepID=A0A934QHR7_9PROT|nr:uroporphyrinogen-III synthase [Rhodovibrio salinarum]MBK1697029.1 hypothetical protein [Rhodovibrio salinarum]
MRVLVTRPRADSEELVTELEARGHHALIEPLLDIRVRDVELDVSDVQALLVTSANGVRAFAELSGDRDVRVLAVGEASAEAARKAGFVGVESAAGDAEALADLAIDRLDPADGPVLHAAGTVTAGRLQERLSAAGFEVRRTPLYEAVPAERLSQETRTALQSGTVDAALFFSPRTAKVFVTLLDAEGIVHTSERVRAICLSEAVASALRDGVRQGRASRSDGQGLDSTATAQGLHWADVRVAERPDRQALLAALDAIDTGDSVQPSDHPDGRSPSISGPSPAPSTTAQAATKDAMTQQDKDDKTPSEPEKQDSTVEQGGPEGTDTDAVQGVAANTAETSEPQDGETADPSNNRALAVIQRFGGIRPMATKLGVAVSTVQGWKNRGAIPESRHDEILAAAHANNINLDRAVLSASGEESLRASPAVGSPWGESGDTPETIEAEEVDRDDMSEEAPEDAEVSEPDTHAAGAEAEASSTAEDRVGAAPAAAATQAPRRSRGWLPGMFLGAAIVVVGAGVAIYTRDLWQPYLPGAQDQQVQPASQQALSDLEATVSDLSGQLADVQDRLEDVGQTAQQAADTAESAAQQTQSATGGATAGTGSEGAEGGGQQVAQLREQVDQLSSRLDQATTRLETLASRVEGGGASTSAATGSAESGGGGESAQRLDTLASRVDELSSQVEQVSQTAATRETAQSLTDRLNALESETQQLAQQQQAARASADGGAGSAAKALAVAELRDALRFSSPFAQQLQAARQVVAGDSALSEALDQLQPMAAEGVPTRAELSSAFDRAAAEAVAADMGASQDGMLGGVLRRLNDVITVRRVDASAEGDSVDARLARAQNKLAAGNLQEAVAIVEQLPDPALGEMQSWLDQANSRLAAETALSELSSQLMSEIAGSATGNGGDQDGSAN